MNWKKIASVLIAGCLMATLAACSGKNKEEDVSTGELSSEAGGETAADSSFTPDYSENVKAMKEINPDTIGWISIPGTSISDGVLFKPDDETNEYYLRKDYNGEYSFNGVYYADFRAVFGDGSSAQLGTNTCIYGHALTDDPADSRYNTKFGSLHNFRNEDFAKTHPYIYFSTEKEDMVFEVVAVFPANADNSALPYNANPAPADFVKMFNEEVKPRSFYHYDGEVTENDKFITLSTCIYELTKKDGSVMELPYPNTYFRYAIMAKLVDKETATKTEASFTVNPDQRIDPDAKMTS